MAFSGVELIKVIGRKLDLGTVEHGKAHAHEYILNFVKCLVHRVLVSEPDFLTRDGDIDCLKLKLGLERRRFKS